VLQPKRRARTIHRSSPRLASTAALLASAVVIVLLFLLRQFLQFGLVVEQLIHGFELASSPPFRRPVQRASAAGSFGDEFGFDSGRLSGRVVNEQSAGSNRRPIYFPPTPPPLDTPSPGPPVGEPMLVAPDELAAYVYDLFYAPLSTRLAQGNLTDSLRRRLDAYQRMKLELQDQLHVKLGTLASVDAATKESTLAAFAREQAPRLAALESTAEKLRADLLRGGLVGLFSGTGDWNEHRTWRLGTGRLIRDDDETTAAKFRVARAAVYYQDGLNTAQRRLLQEIAMELQVQAFKPAGATATADDGLLFFSPDTARVRLPADLPPALADKGAAYQLEKSTLKTELRDTLFEQDRASNSARSRALQQLAEAQAPRVAALEQLAEEIRRELAAHASAAKSISFPPELTARLIAHQKKRAALQGAIHAKLEEISRILPLTQIKVVQHTDDAVGSATLTLEFRTTASSSDKRRLVQAAVTAFNREHREQAAALATESASIRAAITALADNSDLASGKKIDRVLQEFARTSMKSEVRPLYEDYALAVLQPGLSPEQRRLLFDAALQKLALPLPGGEFQP
jgi:hypothetical protein